MYTNKDYRFENLNEDEYEAFLNLKSNKNIIIQKADKGNSVFVIDRLKYICKMEGLLSDRSKFIKIEFNSKHSVNQDITHLLDMELELCTMYEPGIMYGLYKIQKGTTVNDRVPPFRPIL